MPFVEGESLRDRLRRERQLPVEDALQIAREAARALDYAHQHGIVHRDIKPENILLTRDGSTLVADFGIARALESDDKLTQTGMVIGTPAYMSPEQASGDKGIDARTDIYSLGAVLYEMLAGEAPYTGPTAQAIIAKRLMDPVPSVRRMRPNVPEGVDQAIQRALAPVAADRYASAGDFARALQAAGTATTPTAATAAPTAVVPATPPPIAASSAGARDAAGRRSSRSPSCWDSCSGSACCSRGGARIRRRARTPARRCWRCSRSRTSATRPTPTWPTASPTSSAAS